MKSDTPPFDRAALVRYIAEHNLTLPAMAAHVGIPYRTLCGIHFTDREPSAATRAAIERALRAPPPPRPQKQPMRHAETVRRYWPTENSPTIAKRIKVSQQRVRVIAKRIGLPPRSTITKTATE